MSNYIKGTDFANKDALATGNPAKIVKGTEIDDEFNAIAVAINSKANTNSPTLTGTPTAPTPALGTDNSQLATTAFVNTAIAKLGTTNWTAEQSGSDLLFKYNGTAVVKLSSSGVITAISDIVSNDTIA